MTVQRRRCVGMWMASAKWVVEPPGSRLEVDESPKVRVAADVLSARIRRVVAEWTRGNVVMASGHQNDVNQSSTDQKLECD